MAKREQFNNDYGGIIEDLMNHFSPPLCIRSRSIIMVIIMIMFSPLFLNFTLGLIKFEKAVKFLINKHHNEIFREDFLIKIHKISIEYA